VLQAAFFKLSGILPIDEAVSYMKRAIEKTYASKGDDVLAMNYAAVDRGVGDVAQIPVPASWVNAQDEAAKDNANLPELIKNVLLPVNALSATTCRERIAKWRTARCRGHLAL
jgi:pyruvate-ferredoxin/flavodoxin oxidoreductase